MGVESERERWVGRGGLGLVDAGGRDDMLGRGGDGVGVMKFSRVPSRDWNNSVACLCERRL